MNISMFWSTFLGWMPPLLLVLFAGFISLMLIVLVVKLVAFVIDIIPFA